MAEIITLRTPTGGTSAIDVAKTDKGDIELRFKRHLGDGMVRTESVVTMSARHARQVAEKILRDLGNPQ